VKFWKICDFSKKSIFSRKKSDFGKKKKIRRNQVKKSWAKTILVKNGLATFIRSKMVDEKWFVGIYHVENGWWKKVCRHLSCREWLMKNGFSAFIMSRMVDEKWFGKVAPKWLLRKRLVMVEIMVVEMRKKGWWRNWFLQNRHQEEQLFFQNPNKKLMMGAVRSWIALVRLENKIVQFAKH